MIKVNSVSNRKSCALDSSNTRKIYIFMDVINRFLSKKACRMNSIFRGVTQMARISIKEITASIRNTFPSLTFSFLKSLK